MRKWLQGRTSYPPMEAVILTYSKMFNIPPWQFEKECSEEWWHWITEYHNQVNKK